MTAESDESMFDVPTFGFIGSEEEYRDLKSQNQDEPNESKESRHIFRKIVISALVGALAVFGASKILSNR